MIQNHYFLTAYEKINNKFCTNKGNKYESLELAKSACSSEPECEMLYDSRGKGRTFYLCNRPTEIRSSSRGGSVLYIKPGRKYICTRTNSRGIYFANICLVCYVS